MAQLISSIVNNLPTVYNTKVPSLNQSANIEEAFLLYHYGKGKNELLADPTPSSSSLYNHISSAIDRIENLEAVAVSINPLLIMGA